MYHSRCTGSAHIMSHSYLCPVNLPLTCLIAQLLGDLNSLLDEATKVFKPTVISEEGVKYNISIVN